MKNSRIRNRRRNSTDQLRLTFDEKTEVYRNHPLIFPAHDKFCVENNVCSDCGSFGIESDGDMIMCLHCFQTFHLYCVGLNDKSKNLKYGWSCVNCSVCQECDKSDNDHLMMICDSCDCYYHTYCNFPPLKEPPDGKWLCYRCRTDFEFNQCICSQPYKEKEILVLCSSCRIWYHRKCSGISWDLISDGSTCLICKFCIRNTAASCNVNIVKQEISSNRSETDIQNVNFQEKIEIGNNLSKLDSSSSVNSSSQIFNGPTINCGLNVHQFHSGLPSSEISFQRNDQLCPLNGSNSRLPGMNFTNVNPTLQERVTFNELNQRLIEIELYFTHKQKYFRDSLSNCHRSFASTLNLKINQPSSIEASHFLNNVFVLRDDLVKDINLLQRKFNTIIQEIVPLTFCHHSYKELLDVVHVKQKFVMLTCQNLLEFINVKINQILYSSQFSYPPSIRSLAYFQFPSIVADNVRFYPHQGFQDINLPVFQTSYMKGFNPPTKNFQDYRQQNQQSSQIEKLSTTIQNPIEKEEKGSQYSIQNFAVSWIVWVNRTLFEPVFVRSINVDSNLVSDSRCCLLCNESGDGVPAQTSRLLPCGINQFVHLNCIVWASETVLHEDSALSCVSVAVSNAKQRTCCQCFKLGATIRCSFTENVYNKQSSSMKSQKIKMEGQNSFHDQELTSCSNFFYHFKCAKNSNKILFHENRKALCLEHSSHLSTAQQNEGFDEKIPIDSLYSKPLRTDKDWKSFSHSGFYVIDDENMVLERFLIHNLAEPIDSSTWIRIGSLILANLGVILCNQTPVVSKRIKDYLKFPHEFSVIRRSIIPNVDQSPNRQVCSIKFTAANEYQHQFSSFQRKLTLSTDDDNIHEFQNDLECWNFIQQFIDNKKIPSCRNNKPGFHNLESFVGLTLVLVRKLLKSLQFTAISQKASYFASFCFEERHLIIPRLCRILPLTLNVLDQFESSVRLMPSKKPEIASEKQSGKSKTRPSMVRNCRSRESGNSLEDSLLEKNLVTRQDDWKMSKNRCFKQQNLSQSLLLSGGSTLCLNNSTNLQRISLRPSTIHGLGLFALKDFEKNTIIIEYIGVLIRNEVANRREQHYLKENVGVYMFRVSEDCIVDATKSGNIARYINHSCDPNCFAEILNLAGHKRIIITALKSVSAGSELTYDYKLDLEEDGKKIPCLCGAPNCRLTMN